MFIFLFSFNFTHMDIYGHIETLVSVYVFVASLLYFVNAKV